MHGHSDVSGEKYSFLQRIVNMRNMLFLWCAYNNELCGIYLRVFLLVNLVALEVMTLLLMN